MQDMEKHLILLDEYKRGFEEIKKMVDGFWAISNGSQNTFIDSREATLKHQLEILNTEQAILLQEVKKFLAKANSSIATILDTKNFINAELEKCQELRQMVQIETTSEDGGDKVESTKESEADTVRGSGQGETCGDKQDPEAAGR